MYPGMAYSSSQPCPCPSIPGIPSNPRLSQVIPGWNTAAHSHTPVSNIPGVSGLSQVHPGWHTATAMPLSKYPGFPSNPRLSQVHPGMAYSSSQPYPCPSIPVTHDYPRCILGWHTAAHSHTPVQVSQDSLVTHDYPRCIPGWNTAAHD